MSLLFQLIAGHALADFALQTEVMAKYKNWNNPSPAPPGQTQMPCWYYWLTAHALIHGGTVFVITGSTLLGIAETTFHWLIDYLKCDNQTNLHQDQALHIVCKILWVLALPFLI